MKHEHTGMGCPVPLDARVRVWNELGEAHDDQARYLTWEWACVEGPGRIMTYEILDVPVRTFETGATRSADATRYDPEGFLSPLVLERFCEYMNKHRVQPDGSLRASDNWQKGMPFETYAKGLQRHNLHFWARHRGFDVRDPGAAADIEEDLCALLFNASGYLFEILKRKQQADAA